jgi:cell division protease FtsH
LFCFAQAPSVVFIDELDAVGRERGLIKGSGGQERDATLNQVGYSMDFNSKILYCSSIC